MVDRDWFEILVAFILIYKKSIMELRLCGTGFRNIVNGAATYVHGNYIMMVAIPS